MGDALHKHACGASVGFRVELRQHVDIVVELVPLADLS